jgi:hypothetical protein
MPTILFPIEQFKYQPKNSIAVCMCIPKNSSWLHSGIIFNYNNKIGFIHLATHCFLKQDDFQQISDDYKLFIYTNFAHLIKSDPHFVRRKIIIANLQAIFEKEKYSIPYSFLYKNTTFDKDNYLQLAPGEHGLTCSTFVMAVLERNGYTLCKKETWPEREDDHLIREEIVSFFRKGNRIPEDHIKIMESELTCVRFRPEEVLCASAKYPLPCNYDEIQECSSKVKGYIPSN